MALFTKESLENLRQRVDLVDLLSSHIDLKRAGAAFKALCPFHEEKSPSFVVQRGDNHYHCFGCGAHGDGIQFLMTYLKMSFVEAAESLAHRFHVPLQKTEEGEEKKGPDKRKLKEILEAGAKIAHELLLKNEEALTYLEQRGLKKDFIERFQLGWAPEEGIYQSLTEKGFDPTLIQMVGLAAFRGGRVRDFFTERILFPICDSAGSVIGFSGRKIKEETFGGKYINTPDTPLFHKSRVLFGLNHCRRRIAKERKALIVEGQIDALRLIHAGFDFAVAGQGTAFGEGQVRELLQLGVREVTLAFDGDKAGKEAAVKVGNLFQKEGVAVQVIQFAEGADPDAVLTKKGVEGIQQALDSSIDYLFFLVEELMREAGSGPTGKGEVVRRASEQIRGWNDPVVVHESLRRLAHQLHVPEEMVGVAQVYRTKAPLRRSSQAGTVEIDPNQVVEGDLLLWLLLCSEEKEFLAYAEHYVVPDDFHIPTCRRIYAAICEKRPRDLLSLAISLDDDEAQHLISELVQRKVNRDRAKELFPQAVLKILERNWMEKREQVKREIAKGGSDEEVLELVKAFDTLGSQRPQADRFLRG